MKVLFLLPVINDIFYLILNGILYICCVRYNFYTGRVAHEQN